MSRGFFDLCLALPIFKTNTVWAPPGGALRQLMNKFIYQSTNASTLKGT